MAALPPERDHPSIEGSDGPDRGTIRWGRALVSGLLIVALGFLGCVYVPNLIVTDFSGMARSTRADLAAAVSLVALAFVAWVLRRLQSRRLI
jgi:hypothetical protein